MGKTRSSRPMAFCPASPFEMELNATRAAQVWDSFLKNGSNHSPRASLLPFLIRRCEREGLAYRLTAQPGSGYRLELCATGET